MGVTLTRQTWFTPRAKRTVRGCANRMRRWPHPTTTRLGGGLAYGRRVFMGWLVRGLDHSQRQQWVYYGTASKVHCLVHTTQYPDCACAEVVFQGRGRVRTTCARDRDPKGDVWVTHGCLVGDSWVRDTALPNFDSKRIGKSPNLVTFNPNVCET